MYHSILNDEEKLDIICEIRHQIINGLLEEDISEPWITWYP